ncbi:Haemolymph juvenile hormone Hypothetical protein protein (JHBP) [Nesidiocoris tenuis]|uniref:Protein takeout n=1 Tax=Nesidiocoris tenuis TaxID=355587 RepID=A0ABN7A5X5_9HEMI|nr:Haemolymph juvenile hormone Hypothetical protein protein (JHBP) [Nesidiocoris tenuis]
MRRRVEMRTFILYWIAFILGSLAFIAAYTQPFYLWPPALRRCSMNDPELNKCLLKATELAISKVSKGLSLIGLNSLDPLRDAKFTVSYDRWPAPLSLEVDHMSIIGPSNAHIRSVNFNHQTSSFVIQGFHESLRLVGNYRVKGSILLFPINSAGTFDMELQGALADHTLRLSKNLRDASHGQAFFKLHSLNNVRVTLRDPNLGMTANRAMNRLVNDNWKIISRSLTPSLERAVHDIYSEALEPLTSKYTLDDFFPPHAIQSPDDSQEDSEEDEDENSYQQASQPIVAYSYYQQIH